MYRWYWACMWLGGPPLFSSVHLMPLGQGALHTILGTDADGGPPTRPTGRHLEACETQGEQERGSKAHVTQSHSLTHAAVTRSQHVHGVA